MLNDIQVYVIDSLISPSLKIQHMASMHSCFERMQEMDVLAQADMLEADQTPHIWSKPSEKLVLFQKVLTRVRYYHICNIFNFKENNNIY